MSEQHFGKAYGANPAANYERYFVPSIGAPLADDLIRVAELRPGERALDVACGTGVVARLAAQQVGDSGAVAGLDVNPGMIAVARAATPAGMAIEWHEGSAEAMPLPDASFDVVLCQMGLQFMPDKPAALHEMRRVLAPGGRLVINAPGPTPRALAVMGEALGRHVGPQAAGFVDQVFSLHDVGEVEELITGAGFRDASVTATTRSLPLPPPKDFLWQYISSTPLAGALAQLDDQRGASLERDVVSEWQEFVEGESLVLEVRVVTATAGR